MGDPPSRIRVSPGTVTPAGRRPGSRDTRAEILDAARQSFAEEGYERSSVRGIARRAGVDPALVHHYFGDKARLFVELVHLVRDPRISVDEMHAAGGITGARIVRNFLSSWESGSADEVRGSRFATIVEAVASSPRAADALREFLEERVWSRVREPPRNRALITAQLFGLAWTRYILRVEPVASADPEDLARWVGATIDTLLESRPRAEPDDAPE